MGHQKSAQFCKNSGIQVKAHSEGVNSAGGFLVPDEFENEIVTLREQYGVFRRNARVMPLASDGKRIPTRTRPGRAPGPRGAGAPRAAPA
ncbi:MAG: phage major capsid protein, partial [bacterium]